MRTQTDGLCKALFYLQEFKFGWMFLVRVRTIEITECIFVLVRFESTMIYLFLFDMFLVKSTCVWKKTNLGNFKINIMSLGCLHSNNGIF